MRKVYEPSELVSMDIEDVRRLTLRESERVNRALSRARIRWEKSGFDATQLYTQKQLERPTRNLAGMNIRELTKLYAELQTYDLTARGEKQRKTERQQIAEEIGLDIADELTPEDFEQFQEAKRRAGSEAALFYQILVKSVEEGVAYTEDSSPNNYSFFRQDDRLDKLTRSKEGRQQFIREQLSRINDAITDSNKQRDEKGIEKKRDLETLVNLRRKATLEETAKRIEDIENVHVQQLTLDYIEKERQK